MHVQHKLVNYSRVTIQRFDWFEIQLFHLLLNNFENITVVLRCLRAFSFQLWRFFHTSDKFTTGIKKNYRQQFCDVNNVKARENKNIKLHIKWGEIISFVYKIKWIGENKYETFFECTFFSKKLNKTEFTGELNEDTDSACTKILQLNSNRNIKLIFIAIWNLANRTKKSPIFIHTNANINASQTLNSWFKLDIYRVKEQAHESNK